MLLCAVTIVLNLTACDNENTSVSSDETIETSDVQEHKTSASNQISTSDLSGSTEIVAVEGVG